MLFYSFENAKLSPNISDFVLSMGDEPAYINSRYFQEETISAVLTSPNTRLLQTAKKPQNPYPTFHARGVAKRASMSPVPEYIGYPPIYGSLFVPGEEIQSLDFLRESHIDLCDPEPFIGASNFYPFTLGPFSFLLHELNLPPGMDTVSVTLEAWFLANDLTRPLTDLRRVPYSRAIGFYLSSVSSNSTYE